MITSPRIEAHTKARTLGTELTTSEYWTDEWRMASDVPQRRTSRVAPHPLPLLLARHLEQHANEPTDILEIGCAPGTILSQFALLQPRNRFHGVDFCHSGVEQARRLLAGRNIRANVHFADVREFEPRQKFGLVYSCGLIEHFTEPAEILRHHVRLCETGGIVAVSVPNHRGLTQQWFIHQLDPEALRSHNLEIMTVAALRQVFQEVGLTDVTAGSSGPATIRSRTTRNTLQARFLRRVAQAWNLTNRLGPRLSPRRSVIWAYGRVA